MVKLLQESVSAPSIAEHEQTNGTAPRSSTPPPGSLTRRQLEERIESLEAEVGRLSAALKDRASEFDTLLDVIPVGIGVSLDRECKSIRVNRSFAAVLGIETSQNASMTADVSERPTNFACYDAQGKLVPDDQLPMQVSAIDGIEIRDLELDVVHNDGRVVRVLQYAAPILDESGRPRGSVGAFVDITDRKRAADRERRRLAELAHVSRLSTMGEMASGLAHEINQPLAAATNFARVCQKLVADPATAESPQIGALLLQVIGQTERAAAIVKRISSFVKKGPSASTLVDVNDVTRDVVTLIKSCIHPAIEPSAEPVIQLELADALPKVSVDRIQIEQVLLNLLRNAIEASRERGLGAPIVVRTTRCDDFLRITVRDSGSGIAQAIESKLFEPFFTTKPEGMGLGLSISRSIIENHGGRLWAESNASLGASFAVEIPIDAPRHYS